MRRLLPFALCLATVPASAQSYDCLIQPKSIVNLVAADQGTIAEVMVGRGDFVSKGQVLAKLEDGIQKLQVDLTAEQSSSDVEIRAAMAELELRVKELERVQKLAERSVVTERAVEEAIAQRKISELAVERARLAKSLAQLSHQQAVVFWERRTIVAPADGLILKVDGQPGEYAHEQFALMTLAEIDPLKVEAFLPQEQFTAISVGDIFRVHQKAPLEGTYDARVATVDRVFDAASGTFGIVLEIDNPEGDIQAGTRCNLILAAQN